MQKYYSVVTDIGEELIAKAVQENKKLNIVSLAAGDGNGAFYKPTSDMTALKKECWRGDIKSYSIDSISRNVIKVSGVVPSTVGHFVLRELALFDDNDNMIAIANAPDLLKAVLEEGALTEAVVYMRVAFSNTDVVNIQVNTSVVYATVQELEAHENDENAHKELFDKKVDKTTMITELAKKVDETKFTTELAKKVDETKLTTELEKKLNHTSFTAENIGAMLEAAGWQSGGDMTAEEIIKTMTDSFDWKTNSIAMGAFALQSCTNGGYNCAYGVLALKFNTSGSNNVGFGSQALNRNETGNYNTAIGDKAGYNITTGSQNTALGACTFNDNQCMAYNTCTAVGYGATVTGSNQVQLGTDNVTVYAQKAIQTRSDSRDKIDIQHTLLGLEFIKKLTPRQFRMNSREAYFEIGQQRDFSATNDGSKAGKRFHQGFVAQEVKTVLDEMNIDFAGYQDHKINGGEDVLSLGYTEFIAPIVKAIQEQQQMIELQQQKINELEQKINMGV